MTNRKAIPARLHVLLARDAPYGLVIRRGPSRWVCTIGWNRQDDTFTVGQWLHGRIYERRSDLSPCGKHLIYFAMNGQWTSEVKGAWTAISLAPYIKAVGLWAKGDCWHGGGLFIDEATFWLNDGYGHQELRSPPGLRRVDQCPDSRYYNSECLGVYYPRLQRDGWKLVHGFRRPGPRTSGLLADFLRNVFGKTDAPDRQTTTFEKEIGKDWILRKYAHAGGSRTPGRGVYHDEHEIENRGTGQRTSCPAWEWADVDGDRIVWAEGGRLFAGRLGAGGLEATRELYDFNTMAPSHGQAPY